MTVHAPGNPLNPDEVLGDHLTRCFLTTSFPNSSDITSLMLRTFLHKHTSRCDLFNMPNKNEDFMKKSVKRYFLSIYPGKIVYPAYRSIGIN